MFRSLLCLVFCATFLINVRRALIFVGTRDALVSVFVAVYELQSPMDGLVVPLFTI